MIASGIVRLDHDHAEAGEKIKTLHAAVGRLTREQVPGALDATREALAYFEKNFIEHMSREDVAVLPVLDLALGAWCQLPAWMRREHGEIRAKIREVRQALERVSKDDPERLRALADQVERLDVLLTIHFQREDQLLYPIAKLALRPEQWSVIEQAIA